MISLDSAVSLIAPHLCISCGAEGSVLCRACIDNYFQPAVPRCAGCFKLQQDYKTCIVCRKWLPLKFVFTATSYDELGEQVVASCKFDCKRQATEPMADMMKQVVVWSDGFVICPVPTAPSRVRERGFDHTKLISERLSRTLEIPVHQLLRRSSNKRQLGASREQRIKQMTKEFQILHEVIGKLPDKILLVDDVMTTGATLAAAARLLKQAGASEVSAVIFARQS